MIDNCSTSPELTSALIGLVGALLGAALGGGTTLFVASRAARREDKGHRQADRRAIRGAVRLLDEQFKTARVAVVAALERGKWPQKRVFDFGIWDTHAVVLARLVEDSEWGALTDAVTAIRHFVELGEGHPKEGPPAEVIESIHGMLSDCAEAIKAARDVFRSYETDDLLTRAVASTRSPSAAR